jgi:hypothetical protein
MQNASVLNITNERMARRKPVLQEIDNLWIKNAQKFSDPAKLTREDRDR